MNDLATTTEYPSMQTGQALHLALQRAGCAGQVDYTSDSTIKARIYKCT